MSQAILYSFRFSCSLAVKIILRQHDVPFDSRSVERGPARKARGGLEVVNPKRKVPTLIWQGQTLTEIAAILFELDQQLVPERPPEARRALLEWCSFVATELHQQVLGPLFDPDTPELSRSDAKDRLLPPVLDHIEQALDSLGTSSWLLGDEPSGADAYLFWALLLLRFHDDSLLAPASLRFVEHMSRLPFVRNTLAAEAKATAGANRQNADKSRAADRHVSTPETVA